MLACGPAIRGGTELEQAEIIDLAPTILHLLELAIPDDMDGSVLTEMLTADYQVSHPLRHVEAAGTGPGDELSDGYSAEEAAEVEERLRSLGYL